MEIFAAIDLKDGAVVRLAQGDYNCVDIYSQDPAEIARQFKMQGATHLHIVDLNGAKDGTPVNLAAIAAVAAEGGLFLEVGGGIRDIAKAERYLSLGVDRVILGTAAIKDPDFLQDAVAAYGAKIVVGVDTHDGKVAVNGWLETTETDGVAFCTHLRDIGVRTVIYTDISKDGMLSGTNLRIYRTLSEIAGLDIIASGGISHESEITALRDMNITGAIVGKAIYEKKLDLTRVIALAAEVQAC